MFKIKICGITNRESAGLCCQYGADAIGLNFYTRSKRCISVESAVEVASGVAQSTKIVGLFVNHSSTEIISLSKRVGLDLIQLHGDESTSLLSDLKDGLAPSRLKIIRAIRISRENKLAAISQIKQWDTCRHADLVGAFLLDAFVSDAFGGTGKTIDWDWLARLGLPTQKPLILAGGLTPLNVEQAIEQFKPFGVDVAGGVESEGGVKDPSKIEQFVENANRSFKRV